MGDITQLTTQQVLDLVDEFQLIELKDKIEKDGEVVTIYSVALETRFQQKSVGFVRNDAIVSVDRNEYVLQGWKKIKE